MTEFYSSRSTRCQLPVPSNISMKLDLLGSLVLTRVYFFTLSLQLAGFTVSVIFPSRPGGIALSYPATFTPQPGVILRISSTPPPVFLT